MADNDDNLAPLITQCPNCEARFRVTESQLQVAHGRVRCGACLSVFDATAQLLMDGERLSATLDSDVDAFLDELAFDGDTQADAAAQVDAEDAPVPSTGPPVTHQVSQPTSQQTDRQPGGARDAGSAVPFTASEPSRAGATPVNFADDHKDPPPGQPEAGKPAAGSDEPQEHQFPAELLALEAALLEDLKAPEDTPAPRDESTDTVAATTGGADADDTADEDTDWVAELDEAAWSEADVAVPEVQLPTHTRVEGDTADANPAGQDLEAQDLGAIEEPAIAVAEASSAVADEEQPAGREVRKGFEDLRIPEPAVFDEAEIPPRRSWTTLALIGIAVVALPAQVLWFQFDTWAKDERYRPMYSTICSVLGCDLPVMRDLTKLEQREFHMRHHPESDNAYIFDLLIVNVAEFPQPYPVIELIASTERGSLVAGRRFKPEEYLHGEVRPTDLLPPRTPVHISLEIEHPGHPNLEFQTRFR